MCVEWVGGGEGRGEARLCFKQVKDTFNLKEVAAEMLLRQKSDPFPSHTNPALNYYYFFLPPFLLWGEGGRVGGREESKTGFRD